MTGIYPRKLIGFDVRKIASGFPAILMDQTTRERHLPRTDLKALVTFDRYVNPHRFASSDNPSRKDPLPGESIVVPKGRNTGFDLFFLWDDLIDMVSAYKGGGTEDCAFAYAVLDLTSERIKPPADEMFDVLTSTPINPPVTGDDWPLLGFDIVNLYFQSFLSSFDLASALDSKRRGALAHMINDVGLIDSEQKSPAVVRLANSSIADHAPFFALATYLLWDRSGRIGSEATLSKFGQS
jgi:hypothetical protein